MTQNERDEELEVRGSAPFDRIAEAGSVITGNGHCIHCLTVIGQIEGHNVLPSQNKTTKYEHILPQLAMIEDNKDIKDFISRFINITLV